MRLGVALVFVLASAAGCFAPPFPDAPPTGGGHGGHGARASGHHGDPALDAAQGITLTGGCFEVSVPGDATTSWIHGTFYEPAVGGSAALVVLVAGGASFAHIYDGETIGYGRDNGTTLPRFLARNGNAALTIDRLGLGLSPYYGHGARLTAEAQDDHLVSVLTQLRDGAYLRAVDPFETCSGAGDPGEPAGRIVLGGQSLSGWLAMRNAVSTGDADAYLVFGITDQGLGVRNASLVPGTPLNQCSREQAEALLLDGYYEVLCPGDDGLAIGCVDMWVWQETSERAVMEAICANREIHAEPIGSATVFNEVAPKVILARIPNARAPIHFVFGEHDCITNDGPDCDDLTKTKAELAAWERDCPCEATGTWIPRVGHLWQFHRDYELVNADVLAWLRGLGPEAST